MDASQALFAPVYRDARIYVALSASERVAPLLPQLTSDFHHVEHRQVQPVQSEPGATVGQAHAAALENNAPPSVLVDSSFKILHLSPNAGRFFRPMEGPFSADLSTKVRAELRVDLKLALQRAMETGESSLSVPMPVAFNAVPHLVALHVMPAHAGDETVAGQALVFFLTSAKPLGLQRGQRRSMSAKRKPNACARNSAPPRSG
ncbi:hypothetical protein ACNHKD_04445 [Methylocystis sp. JAN1]|uniref:hypothetical protein n=1 Tax=Methylocystis sp. JAN1 TaxID=3397211 RepID=UPI003FA2CE56